MRTRFLNTDYFFTQPQNETLRDFKLLSLSPPPLSSPDPLFELEIPFFDLDLSINSEIDRFPFDNALSQFLSDVIPQFRHSSLSDETKIEVSERVADFLYGDKEVGKCLDFGSETSETEIPKGSGWMKEIQFEVVEVEFRSRECVGSCDVQEEGLRFEVPCIEIPLDNIDIEMGVTITYPYKVAKSICSVEEIPSNSTPKHDFFSVKHDSSSPDKILKHTVKVPQFEVSEIGLGLDRSLSMEEAFSFLLPSVEPQHGAHGDELVVNAKEFMGSTDIDILDHFSTYASSEQCLKDEPISLDSVLEMDLINLNGSMLLEENSVIYPITAAGDCSHLLCSIHFQEVQILDIPSVHIFELFSSSQPAKELDISDQMFKDDMDSVERFYESIVSSELALVDDTFKSLPVPVLCADKDMKSLSMFFGDILRVLKPHSLTACDGLYLDWHPLLEGMCNREICSTYICMLLEVSSYNITSELQPTGEDMVSIDFVFMDDSQERLNTLQCKEVLPELHGNIPRATDPSAKPAVTRIFKEDINKTQNGKQMPNINSENVSSLFESMSQSNDLNFFLDVRRRTARKSSEGETMEGGSGKVTPPAVSLKEPCEPSAFPEVNFEQRDIEVHQVSLSDHILGLIDHIQKSYLAIFKYGTDLRSNTIFTTTDDFEFLSLPKQKLLELITEKSESQFTSGCRDETFMGLLALYAIKQLAYFLCFFGVHTAHLYISNLTRSIDNLVVRLRPLESLIEDAQCKAEKQLIESHPSLSLIEGILRSNTTQNGKKILIIAERFFWLPLNQKLTCMKIKTHEVRHAYKLTNQLNTLDNSGFSNYVLEALVHSDCLLISHEDVLASLPFNKFSIILEYGGPSSSSRVSSISPRLHGFPRVHFLKVSMENHNLPKALCEGFDVPRHLTVEGVSRSMPSLQGILNSKHIEELLSFVPIERISCFSSESENHIDASHDNESSMSMSHSLNSKNISSSIPSSPNVVIIVNTQNFDKRMLISRRSSYQKVLALEKEGVQVVEREINLPLDLIFCAAVCLVWYETRNLGYNTTATSSIPMIMETIATNILMSLSFAFSGCILIFEGESSFLSAIMESSDALYAAAASLDLNLQLFCSYMPESTDEIILSCIGNSTRLNRGLYPAMPESETLGESFLTRFPSINPLSAHAILSSGGMLIQFLEWSQEHRIQAIGKYHIPDESIYLFSALCRYGEMGESKSVMTECSSIDSDISSGKLQSERKRQKYAMSSHNLDMPMDVSFYVEPLNQTNDRIIELPQASQPYQSRNFYNVQDIKKTESHQAFINDEVLIKRRGVYTSMVNNLDSDGTVGGGHLNEDFGDEVINCNCTFLDENYPSVPSTISFFGRPEPRSEPAVRSSLPDRRLAFNLSNHRTFPTSAEINCDADSWTSMKDRNQGLEDNFFGRKAACSNKGDSPMKHQRKYLPKCTRNALGLSNQEKVSPLYGKNLHSKAIQLSRLQRGPQQTFEILNRAKNNREVHHKTLTCNTCLHCPGSSKNIEKSYKIQSPSIIDRYRNQGGSQMTEMIKKKCRKGGKVQDNSNNEEKKDPSFNIPPTWTPIDKRARQYLSFTRTGNEKQSKLVWRNRYSPGSSCSLRKRYQDEV